MLSTVRSVSLLSSLWSVFTTILREGRFCFGDGVLKAQRGSDTCPGLHITCQSWSSFFFFFPIKIIGVTLVNKIRWVSSTRFNNTSYVYCLVCSPPGVKFPSITKYLTRSTPNLGGFVPDSLLFSLRSGGPRDGRGEEAPGFLKPLDYQGSHVNLRN